MKLKTPLRYPGGKSRATQKLAQFLPDMSTITSYREPFLGGGSVALYMAQKYPHLKIWVNDLYNPLYTFWSILQERPQELYEILVGYKEDHSTPDAARELFNQMKIELNHKESEDIYRAAAFYVINKCSFSGLTESSSFSAQASDSNFSMRGIENLPEYSKIIQNWKITNYSYQQLMCNGRDIFIYLDPPYEIKDKLYGKSGNMHSTFNHDTFANQCQQHVDGTNMMVSYNSSQLIRDRFTTWTPYEFDHTYTMRSVGDYMADQKDRKELVLINYGIRSELPLEGLPEGNQSDETELDA